MEYAATSHLMGALNESTAVEEAAFDLLVRTYRPKIFRYALA